VIRLLINELRKDYILDRWVVIASQRKRRPTDFINVKEARKPSVCPFCPGNEHLTPPAVLVYLSEGDKIKKELERGDLRHKNWVVRCIPNLYPAFSPPNNLKETTKKGEHILKKAIGHHEVIIETPNHDEHLSQARITQLIQVIHAYRDRLKALSSLDYVRYVSIFRNYGADAGASLFHPHTQIIATPIIPSIVNEELIKSEKYWEENKKCIFCKIINEEEKSERFIWKNDDFIVFSPWASVHPFEFWIFPKRHQPSILFMSEREIRSFAITIRVSFGGLRNLLDDPSYNLGFHMITSDCYHWHVEVYPRLMQGLEGFVKSTGIFVNTMPPEEAAICLKEAFEKEEDEL